MGRVREQAQATFAIKPSMITATAVGIILLLGHFRPCLLIVEQAGDAKLPPMIPSHHVLGLAAAFHFRLGLCKFSGKCT